MPQKINIRYNGLNDKTLKSTEKLCKGYLTLSEWDFVKNGLLTQVLDLQKGSLLWTITLVQGYSLTTL